MEDRAYQAASTKSPERDDVFNAVEQIAQRLHHVESRLHSISGRVNGYGPENGAEAKNPSPSSLRDRLIAIYPLIGEIESLVTRIDGGIGGDSPNKAGSLR